jgi:hypothetical protein
MIDKNRRRRIVHLLIGINGAGFMLCGTFLSEAVKLGYMPWYGIAGVTVMFFGIIVPFYREFTQLRDGFEEVERETLKTVRRDRAIDSGDQTVLDAGSRPAPFKPARSQPLVAIALTLVGWTLVGIEFLRWWIGF